MATQEGAKALRDQIGEALAFREKSLESRSEWGSITFEKASADLKRIFEVLAHLSVLPLEYLTDSALAQIQGETTQMVELFGRVHSFNIEQSTPTQTRDSLVIEIHSRADQLYTVASPWIPFLAYQKGDVARNIESLTASVGQAQTLIDGAKDTIKAGQSEIETIITQSALQNSFNSPETRRAVRGAHPAEPRSLKSPPAVPATASAKKPPSVPSEPSPATTSAG